MPKPGEFTPFLGSKDVGEFTGLFGYFLQVTLTMAPSGIRGGRGLQRRVFVWA